MEKDLASTTQAERRVDYIPEPVALATMALVVLGVVASLSVVGYWVVRGLGW